MYKSINCPKPECGAPMTLRTHKGLRKMVCTKHKCRALTREFLSVYFQERGVLHSQTASHRHPLPSVAVRCRLLPSVAVRMGVCVLHAHEPLYMSIYIYIYTCIRVYVCM